MGKKFSLTNRMRKGFRSSSSRAWSAMEEVPEADMPVPDRLLQKGRSHFLLNQLKLGQKIGILIWLNQEGVLSPGGGERLLYLQAKASLEAIAAGLKFAQRLSDESKLQLDFKHQIRELNRRPQSRRFRRYESSRIGVGYRDKGTLPEETILQRTKAQEAGWIYIPDLTLENQGVLQTLVPSACREGDWIDLSELSRFLDENEEIRELIHLPSRL